MVTGEAIYKNVYISADSYYICAQATPYIRGYAMQYPCLKYVISIRLISAAKQKQGTEYTQLI